MPKCEHCGQLFDRSTQHPNEIPKRFCSASCRLKRKRNRWAEGRQVRRRELATEHCPTPMKLLFLRKQDAEKHADLFGNTVYECRGGRHSHFHVTAHGLRQM